MSWDMVGHEWAVELLREQAAQGKLRHAYLFTGPSGVGRRTLALRLAQALNCLQPTAPGEPCRMCRSCMQLERMQHPDLSVVQAELQGGTLKVDQVRELQHSLALAPYEANVRVALLLRFEEANASAQNALLKTLEEPSPRVILLLTAESQESLLPTIVSRCEVIRLRPLPHDLLSQALQTHWNIPSERAELYTHLAGGRPGYAYRLNQEPELLERRQSWLDDAIRLLSCSHLERFAYADALTKEKERGKDREGLRAMLQVWLSFWRDILLLSSGSSAPLTNLDRAGQIASLAEQVQPVDAYRIISSVLDTMESLKRNVNPRLALEIFFLDLPEA